MEAGGKVLVDEKDANTTVLVSSVKFLNEKKELARKFAQAHRELTDWILKNPAEAQKLVKDELTEEMKKEMSAELIAHAWPRIILTNDIARESLEKFVANAQAAGFLRGAPDLGRLIVAP